MIKKYNIKVLKEYNDTFNDKREFISRNTNHKGSLTQLSINEGLNYLAIIDYKIGKPARGNHYHDKKEEYLFLESGKIMGYFKEKNDELVDKVVIESGTLITIKPGCIHSFRAISDGIAVEFCKTPINEDESDTFTYIISE